ncbi:MAG: D-tyrosyl-tRNA(Tyr) deacylase [Thermomicrobiales bacterium]|nr:D-tyrosyl-tRNA(Tyr) deacylase [Thermomicrobiales bacterium]
MRVLAQRVSRASVTVDGGVVGAIDQGFLLLVGVTHSDTEAIARHLAAKVANLRVFDDAGGNLNRSLLDLAGDSPPTGAALVVSQFTLYADARKGRRPSFTGAARPEAAAPLVETFASALVELGLRVERGRFGAEMAVELVNDGPVTIWLDSDELRA